MRALRRISVLPFVLAALASCRDGCDDAPSHPALPPSEPPSIPPRPPAPPGPTGRWRHALLPIVADGALPAAAVERIVRDDPRLETCGFGPPTEQDRLRVILRFTINPDGRVGEIIPVQPRPEAQSFRACVTEAARQWQFPATDAGATTALMALEFTPEAP